MKRSKNSKKTTNKQRSNKPAKVEAEKSEDKSLLNRFLNWKTAVVGSMIFLGSIGGFFTDFFSPVKEWVMGKIAPPTYWECSQDKNIRGVILQSQDNENKSTFLRLGKKGTLNAFVNEHRHAAFINKL